MSVIDRHRQRVLLLRAPHDFWPTVARLYPDDPEAWRRLAMLALREDAHWSLKRIARAFDADPTDVATRLTELKSDLRERLDLQEPNPKSQTRNPKQARNPKHETARPLKPF